MTNINKKYLIDYVKYLQIKYPNEKITRQLFRNEGLYSDYTYERLFGTFSQLLSEAGLIQNKYTKAILKAIEKHSENEKYIQLNKEKSEYSEKYVKDDKKGRYKTIIFGSDIHDLEADEYSIDVFIDSIKRIQPDSVVLGGDILDLYSFSNYTKDIRKVDIVSGITWVHKFLERIRNVYDGEIDYIAGNHEARILKHLANKSPETMVLLSDVHGFTLSSLFGLDKYEIRFISKDNLAVFSEAEAKKELNKNYLVKYDSIAYTHHPNEKYGLTTVWGHSHKIKVNSKYSLLNGPYQLIQSGCLCKRYVDYAQNVQDWQNGFVVSHIDTLKKNVQNVIVDTTNDISEVGGKFYYRD